MKINHNIPIPFSRKGNSKYPFQKMKKGDSFWVECTDSTRHGFPVLAKRIGIQLRIKKENKGYRVWRIE